MNESEIRIGENEQEKTTLGQQLKAIRNKASISSEKLASQMGLSRSYVTHWETGRRSINPVHLRIFLDLTNASDEDRIQILGPGLSDDEFKLKKNTVDPLSSLINSFQIVEAQHLALGNQIKAFKREMDIFNIANPIKEVASKSLEMNTSMRPEDV